MSVRRQLSKTLDVFGSCDLDLDPMTFIYDLYPYCLRYTGCANMNLLPQGFRKLSSDRQTNRQKESTEIINHAASRVVSKQFYFARHSMLKIL